MTQPIKPSLPKPIPFCISILYPPSNPFTRQFVMFRFGPSISFLSEYGLPCMWNEVFFYTNSALQRRKYQS